MIYRERAEGEHKDRCSCIGYLKKKITAKIEQYLILSLLFSTVSIS